MEVPIYRNIQTINRKKKFCNPAVNVRVRFIHGNAFFRLQVTNMHRNSASSNGTPFKNNMGRKQMFHNDNETGVCIPT